MVVGTEKGREKAFSPAELFSLQQKNVYSVYFKLD